MITATQTLNTDGRKHLAELVKRRTVSRRHPDHPRKFTELLDVDHSRRFNWLSFLPRDVLKRYVMHKAAAVNAASSNSVT